MVAFGEIGVEVDQELRAAAAALLSGFWTEFQAASDLFRREPTEKHWRELVRVRACYAVAFRCEHQGEAA